VPFSEDSTLMLPLWASMICLAIAKPKPVPPLLPKVANGVKISPSIFSGIPGPLSDSSEPISKLLAFFI